MARDDEYISIGMGIDIEDLRTGLSEAKREMQLAESEFKKNTAGMDAWRDSVEGVTEKLVAMATELQAKKGIVEAYTAELARVTAAYGENSAKAQEVQKKLNDAEASYIKAENYTKDLRARLLELKESESGAELGAEGLRDAVNSLTERVEEQERKVEATRKRLDEAKAVYGENSREANKLTETLKTQEGQLDDLKGALDHYESELREVGEDSEEAASKTNTFQNALAKVKSSASDALGNGIEKLKEGFKNLASKGIRVAVDAVKDFVRQTVQIGMDFTATMSQVRAITGASEDQMKELTATAREYGATTTFSATEAAEALKYMALAGWSVDESTSALGGILDLAAASGMALGEASDIVTDYLTAFGMEASDASRMADLLAYSQANANTTVEQLAEGYKNSAATLAANGQSLETVTSLLAVLSNAGIKGGEAGTALAAVMRDVTNKMSDGAIKIGSASVKVADAEGNFRSLTDILRDVGTAVDGLGSAERADALSDTFSSYSLKGINTLLQQGADAVEGFAESLGESGGAAKRMSDVMNDNLSGDVKSMNSAIEDLQLRLFDLLEGPMRGIVQFITELIPKLIEFGEGVYNFFVGIYDATKPFWDGLAEFFGWLGDAIGIIADAFGKAWDAVSGILDAADAELDTFGKAAVGKIEEPWETAEGFFGDVWGGIHHKFDESGGTFKNIGSTMASGLMNPSTWGNVASFFKDVWSKAQDAFSGSYKWFADLGTGMRANLKKGWDTVSSFFAKVYKGVKEGFSGAYSWFAELAVNMRANLKKGWDSLTGFFSGVYRSVREGFSGALSWFANLASDMRKNLKKGWDTVSGFFSGVWNGIKNAFNGALSWFATLAVDMRTNLKKGWDTVAGFFSGVWSSIKGAFSGAYQWFVDLGAGMVTNLKKGWDGVAGFFSGIWTSIKNAFGNAGAWFSDTFGGAWNSVKDVFGGASGFFSGVWTNVKDAFNNVSAWFSTTFGGAWNSVKDAFNGVSGFFTGVWNDVKGAFSNASTWFSNTFGGAWNAVKNAFNGVSSFFGGVWKDITGAFDDPLGTMGKIGSGLWGALKSGWDDVTGWFTRNVVNPILNVFSPLLRLFGIETGSTADAFAEDRAAVATAKAQADAADQEATAAYNKYVELVRSGATYTARNAAYNSYSDKKKAAEQARSYWASLSKALEDAESSRNGQGFMGVADSLRSAFSGITDIITKPFTEAWGTITGIFGGIGSWFQDNVLDPLTKGVDAAIEEASNLGGGLVEGATTKRDLVAGTTTIGEIITNSLMDYFGIHSPSTLMRDLIGRNIAAGIAVGIADNTGVAVGQIERLSSGLAEAFDPALKVDTSGISIGGAYARQGQPGTVIYNQTINSPEPISAGTIYRDTRSLIGRRTWA